MKEVERHPNLYAEIAAQSRHIEENRRSEAPPEFVNNKNIRNQFFWALEGSDMIPAL